MSISDNQEFDPRFRPENGGFDDAHDVVRDANRTRIAAEAAAELARIQQGKSAALVGQQALVDSGISERPGLYIVDDVETPIFEELGDHLSDNSNLSTRAKIDLMEAMLEEKQRQDADTAKRAAHSATRRSATTHESKGQSGMLLKLPTNRRFSDIFKRSGPRRKS